MTDHLHDSPGKLVAGRRYLHATAIPYVDPETQQKILGAIEATGLELAKDFNIIRIDESTNSIALLHYPDFFEEACPTLLKSWKVDLPEGQVVLRSYEASFNPPILHRKELLLPDSDERRPAFQRLTVELAAQGFFDDPVRIGFKLQWEGLLRERGFRIVGHQLVPIGNLETAAFESLEQDEPIAIARHLTALSRQNFSAPVQILQRFGLLDLSKSFFDYGCGKGDDVRGLCSNGIAATGWDPHFAPDAPISPAAIVNLGFVINVIEDPVERREAVQRAFSLAKQVLVVSTMVATDNPGKVTFYGDGVLTSRATFQKYYTQSELKGYLDEVLGDDSIPVAPGVIFVFRDKDLEQRFQLGRHQSRIRLRVRRRAERTDCVDSQSRSTFAAAKKYELHRPILDPLWKLCVELGREPDEGELENVVALQEAFGTTSRALKLVLRQNSAEQLAEARKQRTDDLKVYLAAQLFQKKKPYKQLEPQLQRSIRVFFGDYTSAQNHARHLLSQVAQPEILDEACRIASEQGLGFLEPGHSLQLHTSLVARLPAALRVYVSCAAVLYGDPGQSDLVKIHIRSGKVSFMKFDDFLGLPVPKLSERVKINLRTLDFRIFVYGGDFPSPPLYLKSRYMNEELPGYAEQLAFDEALKSLETIDLSGFGPSDEAFRAALRRARWEIEGFRLARSRAIPSLDDACGRYLSFRKLILCGETQAATCLPNLPANPESYNALQDLAIKVLDPVIEYFGGIELTYGFCSGALARHIRNRIAPELDQHAAHEIKRSGKPICARLGAAVDFFIQDEDMREVAEWIIANVPFDRLYFYGKDRPLHVSYGPQNSREAFEMISKTNGRLMPKRLKPVAPT